MSARLPASVRRLPLRLRVAAELEALPADARTVLALRLLERLTPLETAGALGCSLAEANRRYADALRLVSARLTDAARPVVRRARR
ncbi:MAG TPA: sigma factor-like helix-turn-helix DNA-binding protein, partial [Candidatus Eisenbacteria bacterium]|nr:sigma factor-like helix-turn-helix DNA-binding protein [Candidatus Eisenbacteria bacterium]